MGVPVIVTDSSMQIVTVIDRRRYATRKAHR
jgi:hypothetical protein